MAASGQDLIRQGALGLALAAVAMVVGTTTLLVSPDARDALFPRAAPLGSVGEKLGTLPVGVSLARRNVLVFSRYDCSPCQRSTPVLAELA